MAKRITKTGKVSYHPPDHGGIQSDRKKLASHFGCLLGLTAAWFKAEVDRGEFTQQELFTLPESRAVLQEFLGAVFCALDQSLIAINEAFEFISAAGVDLGPDDKCVLCEIEAVKKWHALYHKRLFAACNKGPCRELKSSYFHELPTSANVN